MQHATLGYRADIDGLRAIAVVSVLLFHSGVSTLSGGYVGVDIFFVISGFVIALSINRDLLAGSFSISGFYERRARRILPALTLVLLATLAGSLWLAPPEYFEPFARSLASAGSFLSNVHFWHETNYFSADSPFRPLLHTWSLAVEEQYYVLAPIFLYLIFRFLGRRWAWGIAPVLLASFAAGVYAISHQHIDFAFYMLPTRAWEILLGALIALSPPPLPKQRVVREALAVVAVAMMAASIFLYTPATPFPGFAALLPCVGAALLLYVGAAPVQPVVNRVLASRPFVAVGLISYSLYLVHWPVMILGRFALMRQMTAVESAAAIVACFVLATAMYFLVERPLRRAPASRAVVFAVSALAIAITIAAGIFSPALNRQIFPEKPSETASYRPDWATEEKGFLTGTCLLVVGESWREWSPETCARTEGAGGDVLLFGDSFAAHYGPGLEAMQGRIANRVIEYSMQGCPPILSHEDDGDAACVAFLQNVVPVIEQLGIKRVIIAGSWLEYGADMSMGVESSLRAFRDMGLEVTLIGQSPNFYLQPSVIADRLGRGGDADVTVDIGEEASNVNARLRALAERTGAHFIDPIAALCKGAVCPVRLNRRELFMDYGHFTAAGSEFAVASYFPYVSR